MKAQFVYENIEFERGLEPRHAMNIGMFDNPSFLDRLNVNEIADLLLKYLPIIIGEDEIPEDILMDTTYYLNRRYINIVQDFIIDHHSQVNRQEKIVDILGKNPFPLLRNKLRDLGFETPIEM